MKRWTAKAVIALFAGLSVPMLFVAQINETGEPDVHRTDKHNTQPSTGAKITKFSIAEAAPNSGYETGPLHIIYSDGAHVIQELPPLKKSTAKETIFNAVGFSQVQLAADRQTLGWAIQVENCCTSYSLALSVVLFRSGRILRSISTGHMVWSWMFLQGGKQVAVVTGLPHGPEVGDYRLYSVATGKLLAEMSGDEQIQGLKPDAPAWARSLEDRFHGRATQ